MKTRSRYVSLLLMGLLASALGCTAGSIESPGSDAGAPRCGNGVCDPAETCASCPADCNRCPGSDAGGPTPSDGGILSSDAGGGDSEAGSSMPGVFTTNVVAGATISTPFDWTFDPGVPAVKGYFWADGTLVQTVTGAPPYTWTLPVGLLSDGAHSLGHGWDLSDGTHGAPPSDYPVTIDNPAPDAGPTGTPTFESETAYLDTPLPDLSHAIVVSSASALSSALSSATAGQTIDVLGTVTISGQFTGFNRVISGGGVNVVFEPGVTFTGNGGTRYPAVFLQNTGGWRVWGGDISNPDGNGILIYALPGPFTWTGFTVGQTADTGVAVYPVGGDIANLTLAGVSGSSSENLAYDPHSEKGTGEHAWNIADATGGIVRDSTFAADTRDQATGAAVEVESDRVSNVILYARARHVGFALAGTTWTGDATSQVAGNVVQLWGGTPPGNFDIRYEEGNDIQGRILETDGVYSSADLSNISVDYGVATGPILQNTRLSRVAYAVTDGLHLGDCSPLP